IVGPRDDVDPALLRHPNVEWVGAVPHDKLPLEAERADVLVMPYADMPATRAMQPLKLLEYLATGLPVVVTPLPATRSWSDAMDLAATPEAFVAAVVARISGGLPDDQRRARARLVGESWKAKADQFERLCLSDEGP
ncbi:MAG: glycosyltransferase, partial [Alphaproteobacteria bacterium]|nr:glycosyltransferase [Alphaproteobacteria bacterium]